MPRSSVSGSEPRGPAGGGDDAIIKKRRGRGPGSKAGEIMPPHEKAAPAAKAEHAAPAPRAGASRPEHVAATRTREAAAPPPMPPRPQEMRSLDAVPPEPPRVSEPPRPAPATQENRPQPSAPPYSGGQQGGGYQPQQGQSGPGSAPPNQGQPPMQRPPYQPQQQPPQQGGSPQQQPYPQPQQQQGNSYYGNSSGQGGGGGGGGGGGYYQQRPQYGGPTGQGGMGMMQGGRRKKKKRKGGGMMMGPGGPPHYTPSHHHSAPGYLPQDEELQREAEALERIAGSPEYAEAEKKALHVSELQRMEIGALHKFAEKEGLLEPHKTPRQELIFQILKKKAADTGLIFGEGTLDISEGFGFLRSPEQSYLQSPDDIYVAPSMIRRFGLRKGMEVQGAIRPPKDNERFFALLRIDKVNGQPPQKTRTLPIFEDLTPLHPEQRYVLETTPDQIEMRIVDLVSPIGRGQRGLIVAPPRTGKTVLLQKMAQAISKNYPEVKVIVLLIDERPEEVTDFRRNTTPSVEVIASTFDEDSSRHVAVTEMVMEKARRYVEYGQHVVILLDSITRLARAYNANMPHSGKIMTGGIDSNALQRPKKFFGSARAIEHGGSLTILGTALVDTGSKADEVIFEEFKGTGNSELHLDRKLVEKRIWPAIDVSASGTRREELLLDPKELELTYRLRKVLSDMNVVEAMELMKGRLKKAKTNAEFLVTMNLG